VFQKKNKKLTNTEYEKDTKCQKIHVEKILKENCCRKEMLVVSSAKKCLLCLSKRSAFSVPSCNFKDSQERLRDREVLVGEAGRERALMWRMMDAMERRRRWREGKGVLQAWRVWFSTHVRARVKRLLHSRRFLCQLFLRWGDAVAGEKESMRQRDLTVALEAHLQTHRVRERERDRQALDAVVQWAGVAGVEVGVGMCVASPSLSAFPHATVLEAKEGGAGGSELSLSRIASVESASGAGGSLVNAPPSPATGAASATSTDAGPAIITAACLASAYGGHTTADAAQAEALHAAAYEQGWLAFARSLQGAQEAGARARLPRTLQAPSAPESGVQASVLSPQGLLALFVRAWYEHSDRRGLMTRLAAGCIGAVHQWRCRCVCLFRVVVVSTTLNLVLPCCQCRCGCVCLSLGLCLPR